MPLTPRGLYRVKLIGELHGQLTETAFHFTTSEVSGESSYFNELNNMMDDFILQILPKYQLFCSQEWAAKTVTGITLIPAQEVFIEKRIASGTGVQPNNSLPSFCAGLLSLRTGAGGRSRIGRLFIPGVSEDLSSNSRLEGSYLGLLSALGAGLTGRYGNNSSYPYVRYGVFSRKLGVTRVLLPFPHLTYNIAGFKIVTSTVARPEVATMRRRKLARGQ
jgi:hypothetical protein